MYTGALENHPGLVERISQSMQLWGNDARALRKVRSPWKLAEVFRAADIPFPAVDKQTLSRQRRRALLKPLKGSAGRHISLAGDYQNAKPGTYLQEYIEGDAVAAIYVGDGQTALLLGVTQQLTGQIWLHAKPFGYCGSIGPLPIESALHERMQRIGEILANTCGLRGLFGVDCILRDGIPWPVEVNPRYTASVEVLEYATRIRALDMHRVACTGGALMPFPLPQPSDFVGKAILFAAESVTFRAGPWDRVREQTVSLDELPAFADVPHEGQLIKAGAPVLTFFACGASPRGCLDALREIARDLDRRLFHA
jgi:predicted ATP-grasp superfamily ATP-dependent carboligase